MGGLSTAEIARAFLVPEPTIAQRLVRAKRTIRDRALPYEVPEGADLIARLPAVLAVVYLIFNEGYAAHTGDAARAPRSLRGGASPRPHARRADADEPEVLGLVALMELQASRAATRTDADGNLVLLADQDRARWDQARIARGLAYLDRAGPMERAGAYQLQAAIAACHARAASWEATDWPQIVAHYRALAEVAPSPVVELNRAVAIGLADGPEAGLAALDQHRRLGAARLPPPARRSRRFPPPARAPCGGGRRVPPGARARRQCARAGLPGGEARCVRGTRRDRALTPAERAWRACTRIAGLSSARTRRSLSPASRGGRTVRLDAGRLAARAQVRGGAAAARAGWSRRRG